MKDDFGPVLKQQMVSALFTISIKLEYDKSLEFYKVRLSVLNIEYLKRLFYTISKLHK